ncbi:hypothetical protein EDD59_1076 [Muricomes intestini]|jgi:hypothetical protein|uniref:SdpI/YhfL family protein n=1 Tax=Muricomes intestini TaxID=1796634 RepID=A0A4R3KA24_9FIRM|nr:hypothetical protein [Muricomes intestini]TCS79753.1 hypothetical protein EDD59_1076 [Muricomes intestini]
MDDMFGAISILVLGAGIYIIYAYMQMKQTGHINEVLLLGKGFTEQMCKDKKEFIQKALPTVLILGIVTIFYGAVDAIHYFVTPVTVLDLIAMAAFVVVLIWYMVYTTKLKKRYF